MHLVLASLHKGYEESRGTCFFLMRLVRDWDKLKSPSHPKHHCFFGNVSGFCRPVTPGAPMHGIVQIRAVSICETT